MGATYESGRVVVDGNLITGGGVTAGLDFALRVAAEVADERYAQALQLGFEYDPQPPFVGGHPERAPAELVDRVRARYRDSVDQLRPVISVAVVPFAFEIGYVGLLPIVPGDESGAGVAAGSRAAEDTDLARVRIDADIGGRLGRHAKIHEIVRPCIIEPMRYGPSGQSDPVARANRVPLVPQAQGALPLEK